MLLWLFIIFIDYVQWTCSFTWSVNSPIWYNYLANVRTRKNIPFFAYPGEWHLWSYSSLCRRSGIYPWHVYLSHPQYLTSPELVSFNAKIYFNCPLTLNITWYSALVQITVIYILDSGNNLYSLHLVLCLYIFTRLSKITLCMCPNLASHFPLHLGNILIF